MPGGATLRGERRRASSWKAGVSSDIPIMEAIRLNSGPDRGSAVVDPVCGLRTDLGRSERSRIPPPLRLGSDSYMDLDHATERHGWAIAAVTNVKAVADALNIDLPSPSWCDRPTTVSLSHKLTATLRAPGPRPSCRRRAPVRMDQGGWVLVREVRSVMPNSEASLVALVLYSDKSRFQLAVLGDKDNRKPRRRFATRATNGHSILWQDRDKLTWRISLERYLKSHALAASPS